MNRYWILVSYSSTLIRQSNPAVAAVDQSHAALNQVQLLLIGRQKNLWLKVKNCLSLESTR